MKFPLLPVLCVAVSSPLCAADRTNPIPTETFLKTAVVEKQIPTALAIRAHGGFSGFQAAPGCTLDGNENVLDWLVQKIAIDDKGNPTDETPLTAKNTRNLRLGDKLPYYLSDYTSAPNKRHHRYNYQLATAADSTGGEIPIVASFRDLTPSLRSDEFNTLGKRDIVSIVGIYPDYACYSGAYIQSSGGTFYSHSFGAGYADKDVEGIARFAHPLFPNPVPPPGARWYATVLQKVIAADSPGKIKAHDDNSLAVQLTFGKRLMFPYGIRGQQTKPIDTVVAILAHNNPNTHGTAPILDNASRQHERIYICREFGYSTRWELWNCDGDPKENVIATAQKFYAANSLGPPADLSGKYNDHLEIGPVIEDKALGVYKHTMTLTDPDTGEKETRTWYLTGGHDYTNLQPQPPANSIELVAPKDLPPDFLSFFGIPSSPAAAP